MELYLTEDSMTKQLFSEDAYQRQAEAEVLEITPAGEIVLNQTIFYATSGGQPGDNGLIKKQGEDIKITTASIDKATEKIVHVPEYTNHNLSAGDVVELVIDWDRRYTYMRYHTAMHLLCSLVPCSVTGGQLGFTQARLDFNTEGVSLDKQELSEQLHDLIDRDITVTTQWITFEELLENQDLIRTMSVKPPKYASGKVKLVNIDGVDLQPCGGTHVRRTSEIGKIEVTKIESKGKKNKRIKIQLI
jgi:misacylated tRNA(Ala) deacylase